MKPALLADVLRPNEFRQRLGLGWSRFCELQQQGRFRALEHHSSSAVRGRRVYSRKAVEAFFAHVGQSRAGTPATPRNSIARVS